MPTLGKLSGSLYKIKVGATNITNLMSSGMKHSTGTRDVTTKDSGADSEFLATLHNWTKDFELIVALDAAYGVADLYTAKLARTPVAVVLSTGVTGDEQWSGNAIITELDIKTGVEDNVMVSGTLQGTGALTMDTVA